MKFTKFRIINFKGIEDVTINLDKSPEANIYTLVGLNESGKTTILEAINSFNPSISPLDLPGSTITDYNSLIPISKRDNFNGKIQMMVTLKLESNDLKKINEFAKANTNFSHVDQLKKSLILILTILKIPNSQTVMLDGQDLMVALKLHQIIIIMLQSINITMRKISN